MAELLVRNSLNTSLSVRFNVSIKQFIPKGEQGDLKWLLEVATTYLDRDGYNIRPKLVHVATLDNIDDEIEKAVAEMCDLIDWGDLRDDKEAPFVFQYYPSGADASIFSNVTFTIKEDLPAAGIDLSEAKIILDNGTTAFDITSEVDIEGDPYEYSFRWSPQIRVFDTYGD